MCTALWKSDLSIFTEAFDSHTLQLPKRKQCEAVLLRDVVVAVQHCIDFPILFVFGLSDV